MKLLYSHSTIYTFLLLILPVLIITSWFNASIGNTNYSLVHYLLTYILPTLVLAYAISLVTAKALHKSYSFTLARVVFTLFALVGLLSFFSFLASLLGFNAVFVTATLQPIKELFGINIQDVDTLKLASMFYSLQLIFSLIVIVIFYAIASRLFEKKKRKIVREETKQITTKKTVRKRAVKKEPRSVRNVVIKKVEKRPRGRPKKKH